MPKAIRIVEVGLRDGLQNESTNLSVELRFELLKKMVAAGVKNFEIGAFVSAQWVPQMAVTGELVKKYQDHYKKNILHPSVLIPNLQGLKLSMDAGVNEVAIFASATETFSQKNINCSIAESFKRFQPIMEHAKKNKIKVRGYLSVCFGCPFEGKVSEAKVIALAKKLIQIGCYEVSIGDTIGVANVGQVESLFKKLKKVIPAHKIAGHFHDTRGQALANILQAYKLGITTFDSSIGGLGGCPYAKGATGNVATEDVVYMFSGLKVKTGLNLKKLIEINQWLNPLMTHPLASKVGRIGLLKI
jgi:hydroxymethylglutaryl-CoA lyase